MKLDFRENIAILHSIIDGIPSDLINLNQFKEETECGTICCGAGWAAMHPYFQAQNLRLNAFNIPTIASNKSLGSIKVLNALFGHNAFSTLFERRGNGDWDIDLFAPGIDLLAPGMTDKELLLARLKKGYHQYAPKHNS